MVKIITGILFGVTLVQFINSPEGRAIYNTIARHLSDETRTSTDDADKLRDSTNVEPETSQQGNQGREQESALD